MLLHYRLRHRKGNPMTNPAETYESFMVPTLFEPLARQMLDLVKPSVGDRVLDVACGTGIVARRLAETVGADGNVTGIDITPPMLAVARARSEQEGLDITWVEGAAEALPFPDESFDLVVSQAALMFFADPQKALAEMHRVLVPGGRVAVSVFQAIDRHPFYQELHRLVERHLGTSGVADIFSLGDAEHLRMMLELAGFSGVTITPLSVTSNFGKPDEFITGEIDVDTASIPAMQHLDEAARQNLRDTIRQEMAGPLGDVTLNGRVVIPFYAQIASGYR